MITSPERAFLVEHLEASRDAFAGQLLTCDAGLWSFRPKPECWSFADCAEHTTTVEWQIARALNGLGDVTAIEYDADVLQKKTELILTLKERTTKIQAPEGLHPKGRYTSPAECLQAFLGIRKEMIEKIDRDAELLRGRFIPHPFLRKLDGYQWLLSASAHVQRHTAQLIEIRELRTTL